MCVRSDLLKAMISSVDTLCETKQDVLRLLKEELIALEEQKSLNLFNTDDNVEREFHLSLASQDDYWNRALKKEEAIGIDIHAYKERVMAWNDTLPKRDRKKKRTPRGWLATARQFMGTDKDKGKLIMVLSQQNSENKKMVDYLKL